MDTGHWLVSCWRFCGLLEQVRLRLCQKEQKSLHSYFSVCSFSSDCLKNDKHVDSLLPVILHKRIFFRVWSYLRSPPFIMVMTRQSSSFVWKAYASDTMKRLWTFSRMIFSTIVPCRAKSGQTVKEHQTIPQSTRTRAECSRRGRI